MPVMTVPNYLSLFRILVTPAIIYFLFRDMHTHVFILFALAVISDGVDGYIARKYHLITELGKFLDPFADKFLLILIFNTLAMLGRIPLWFFLVVFGKELILMACWMSCRFIIRETRVVADKYGKVASGLLMLLVTCTLAENLNYAPFKIFNYLIPALILISPVLIVISLLSYVSFGVKQISSYQNIICDLPLKNKIGKNSR